MVNSGVNVSSDSVVQQRYFPPFAVGDQFKSRSGASDSWSLIRKVGRSLQSDVIKGIFTNSEHVQKRLLHDEETTTSLRERRKSKENTVSPVAGYRNWSKLSYLNFLPGQSSTAAKDRDECADGDDCDDDYDDDPQTIVIRIVPQQQTTTVPSVQHLYNSRYFSKVSPGRSNAGDDDDIISSSNDRSGSGSGGYGYGGGGGSSAAALLALLPLLLIAGLVLGYLLRNSSSSTSGSTGSTVNSTNIVNINGTNIANLFLPNNTAVQSNTQSQNNNITISGNGNNNNFSGRAFVSPPLQQQQPLLTSLLQMAGVPRKEDFPFFFVRSISEISATTILNQTVSLARKLSCVEIAGGSRDCTNRVVCEHLAQDNVVYPGNMMIRISELYLTLLSPGAGGGGGGYSPEEAFELMDVAEKDICEIVYENCIIDNVRECLDIV